MSEEIDNGGPAFPVALRNSEGHQCGPSEWQHPGLSVRDWFAGMAMQAHIQALPTRAINQVADRNKISQGEVISKISYEIADAMLAARKK